MLCSPHREQSGGRFCSPCQVEAQGLEVLGPGPDLPEGVEESVCSIRRSLLQLQQLLTDLPHDMLDDDLSSPELNSSRCSEEIPAGQTHPSWEQITWNEHPVLPSPPNGYEDGPDLYPRDSGVDGWTQPPGDHEGYGAGRPRDGVNGGGLGPPVHLEHSDLYHLPEDFRPFTGAPEEFPRQQSPIGHFPDAQREQFQPFGPSRVPGGQPLGPYKVSYRPYSAPTQHDGPLTQDKEARKKGIFEELQQEFLGLTEQSAENMQVLQLQVLNKAKGRQLEELGEKLEESGRQVRYLNHQLAMVRDEKAGLTLSLQETQKLFQNGKEREVQLEGQVKILETEIQTLRTNEEQVAQKAGAAEAAVESLQQQLAELRRTDTLQRARERHEAVVTALRRKHEEQASSLQRELEVARVSLQEQKDLCCRLEAHVKQAERLHEESKLEKSEIISRLSRSLEESQQQCANLLRTGPVQEVGQLRFQLQQAQAARSLSDSMNKALQEELTELKEELALYESAAKLGVFPDDTGAEANADLTDSYVDLGIKQAGGREPALPSSLQPADLDLGLTPEQVVLKLRADLQRLMSSHRLKCRLVSQLQQQLRSFRAAVEDSGPLARGGKTREVEMETGDEGNSSPSGLCSAPSQAIREDHQQLKNEIQILQQEIVERKAAEEKLKTTNQDLCNQIRQMIHDFDRDKQEAIERCERTYQQHHEVVKAQVREALLAKHCQEKERLLAAHEDKRLQLRADLDQVNKEMASVQECYLAVCREKDQLEATLRRSLCREQQVREDKLKEQLSKAHEESLSQLRAELEQKHRRALAAARSQWLRDREADVQRRNEGGVSSEEKQPKIREQGLEWREWRPRPEQTVEGTKECTVDRGSQTERERGPDLRAADPRATGSSKEGEEKEEQGLATRSGAQLRKDAVATERQLPIGSADAEEQREDRPGSAGSRIQELEDQVLSLKRELELREGEVPALVRAELAKARVEWSKEKQEQILRIQEQNKADYREFLDGQRTKMSEMLSAAKEDCAKQKAELVAHKEAEFQARLDQKQREWLAQESQRVCLEVQQYEEAFLLELELLLGEIHEELVGGIQGPCPGGRPPPRSLPRQPGAQCLEQLRACVRKAYHGTLRQLLHRAKPDQGKSQEDFDSSRELSLGQNGPRETGDHARLPVCNVEQQIRLQTPLRKSPPPQETQVPRDRKGQREISKALEDSCCGYCFPELARTKEECQDLRRKLEKACRQLQRVVRVHKAAMEKLEEENRRVVKGLTEENDEMKLELRALNSPPRSLSEGAADRAGLLGDRRGLEELRTQYIQAVDRIKGDMLRYIRESRERAAEILQAEVLRERQETARRVYKHFLLCVQQHLRDQGGEEGADRRILTVASQLGTIVKGLETPLPEGSRSESTPAAPTRSQPSRGRGTSTAGRTLGPLLRIPRDPRPEDVQPEGPHSPSPPETAEDTPGRLPTGTGPGMGPGRSRERERDPPGGTSAALPGHTEPPAHPWASSPRTPAEGSGGGSRRGSPDWDPPGVMRLSIGSAELAPGPSYPSALGSPAGTGCPARCAASEPSVRMGPGPQSTGDLGGWGQPAAERRGSPHSPARRPGEVPGHTSHRGSVAGASNGTPPHCKPPALAQRPRGGLLDLLAARWDAGFESSCGEPR
ncbi:centrosomal protein of 152 kDa isoform X2 [Ornithorhynchus anatinus]|uniref:centrosomal protein of 152 kDa isoform X2 n=1 Tax=Ornithorhynchus anatinus TaxID=9258 RepID=UPI0019D426EE|nr:centrosomal protein of 152 kDa isoform X2 [Ornithorhynchus anatinus]